MEDERICTMCGCILQEHEQTEIDEEWLCDECAEQHTTTCDHCGETIWANDSICDDRTTLCSCCFDDHYRRCEGCGRILHDDDVLWHNDLPYCANCYDRLDTEIEEYGYKPEPIFYGEGSRFFGVELEVDFGGKDEENARRIKAQANTRCENIYIKSDGSLDDGFEIVTHPMTLGYHMDDMYWEDILHEAVRLGYRSHMTSTCGLHIHVNRDAFGEDRDEQERVIERILYFVELHWNELFIFSRRSQHNMQRWAARYGLLNGVYDIQKRSFSKEQDDLHFDYVLNFNYMYNVRIDQAKVFVRFVESSLGREYLLCLLRILAYLISSLISGRKAFLLLGKGSTGKSTLLELIEAVVDVINTSHVPFHMMGNIHARAEYQDKRMNISRDNSDAPMRNEDAFKNLVSCEMTSGRRLYENLVDFIPRLKFIFASNVDLHFAHPDDAVYDRLLVIPFTKKIPEKNRDRELLQKLLDEKDNIFSVAIDQLSDLVQSGYDFKEPDASIQIINRYREALHTAESYLRECCDVCGGGEVSSVELYQQYRSWCSENGMEPDGRNAFYSHVRAFSDSISEGKVAHGGKRVNGFRGIRPKYTGDAQESDKLTE